MENPEEVAALDELSRQFMQAVSAKNNADFDRAEELLREIIRTEPRLAEPHMELGRILLDTDRVDEAEQHAREAIDHLEAGSQWTDEIPENIVAAVAHALLAEILRRRAESDAVIFGDPEVFQSLIAESRSYFEKAATLDPSDATTSYYAFFMGAGRASAPAPAPLPWGAPEPGEA